MAAGRSSKWTSVSRRTTVCAGSPATPSDWAGTSRATMVAELLYGALCLPPLRSQPPVVRSLPRTRPQHDLGIVYLRHGVEHFVYSEGLASAIALAAIEEMLEYPGQVPAWKRRHLVPAIDLRQGRIRLCHSYAAVACGGCRVSAVDPDIVDGIWLFHEEGVPHFADRFFLPLQPLMIEYLGEVLCQVQEQEITASTLFSQP